MKSLDVHNCIYNALNVHLLPLRLSPFNLHQIKVGAGADLFIPIANFKQRLLTEDTCITVSAGGVLSNSLMPTPLAKLS